MSSRWFLLRGATACFLVLLIASLLAWPALVSLEHLLDSRRIVRSPAVPEGLRELGVPTPSGVGPRDRWTPIGAGLRELGRREHGAGGKALRRLYEENGFRPLWVTPSSLTEAGQSLIAFLASPHRAKFSSDARRLMEIGHLFHRVYAQGDAVDLQSAAELEWALSKAFWVEARRLVEGTRPSARSREDWSLHDQPADVVDVFRRAQELGVSQTLRDLARSHESLTSLLEALTDYQKIERSGGWPKVEEGDALEPGHRSERVLALRRRLQVTGDLESRSESDQLDSEVEAAVRRFQHRHGLNPDGRVGRTTLAALNVPVEERVRQLALNLERRRWLPGSLGDEFLWVNIPEFRLRAFRQGRVVLDMPVVVGAPRSPTPSFDDEVELMVLNPYWDVPESIAAAEIAPKAEKDSSYLRRASFELLDRRGTQVSPERFRASDLQARRYRIRRKPGPANDLGQIKFLLPNPFDVYLHDTPSRHLFERSVRAFSHGCVRLGRPLELARYLFPDRFRDRELETRLALGTEQVFRLAKPVPIYIVYFTAWRGEDGLVHFRDDVYGHDRELSSELEENRPVPTGNEALGLFWSIDE